MNVKSFLNARFGIQVAAGGITYIILRLMSSLFLTGFFSMVLSLIAYGLVFVAAGDVYDQHKADGNNGPGAAT